MCSKCNKCQYNNNNNDDDNDDDDRDDDDDITVRIVAPLCVLVSIQMNPL